MACDGGDTDAAAVDAQAPASVCDLAGVVAREAGELAHAHVVTVVRMGGAGGGQIVMRWSPTGARGPSGNEALELAAGVAAHRAPRRIVLRSRAIDGMPSASGLVLPILAGEMAWGALIVTLHESQALRESTERQLAALASLAAPVLAGGTGRPGRRRSDAVVGGAPRAIPGAAVARRATDIASEALGGMLVRTIALDGAVPPVPRALAVACRVPVLRPPLALDVALVSAIGVGERSLRVADLVRDPRFQTVAGSTGWHGAASVPVAIGHEVCGAITAYGDARGTPTAAAARFLLAAANVVAAALDCPRWGVTVTGSRA